MEIYDRMGEIARRNARLEHVIPTYLFIVIYINKLILSALENRSSEYTIQFGALHDAIFHSDIESVRWYTACREVTI